MNKPTSGGTRRRLLFVVLLLVTAAAIAAGALALRASGGSQDEQRTTNSAFFPKGPHAPTGELARQQRAVLAQAERESACVVERATTPSVVPSADQRWRLVSLSCTGKKESTVWLEKAGDRWQVRAVRSQGCGAHSRVGFVQPTGTPDDLYRWIQLRCKQATVPPAAIGPPTRTS